MTGCVHIVSLYVLVILVLSFIPIVIIHSREEKLRNDKDFVEAFIENREKMLQRSAVPIRVQTYLSLSFLSAIVTGTGVFLLTVSGFMAVLFGVAGVFIPDIIIGFVAGRKKRKFDENYAKALEQMASSLKAGLSIQLAVKDVVESPFIEDSLRRQFALISSDLQMGRSVQEAFKSFAEIVNSSYADDVALSIDIQNETGGHEAEVIKDIADGIRERILLGREIKSIFTETVLTIRVIQLVAPLSMAGMLILVKSYREIYLNNSLFTAVLILLVGMEIAGVIVDNSMITDARRGK
ncbi:MAG: type II secretion system F family protein [Lachnospiraceae bacterium]|nr:type II secretion system F family protein [Lachnospiraceae bacterium]